MKSIRGYLFIIAATIFWGVSASVAKFLITHDVDTLVLVQMRILISCVFLLTYVVFFRRDYLRVQIRDLYRFALLGIIGGAGSNFTYYFTIEQTNVATAILLQYMAPLFVLLYAAISRDEIMTTPKLLACVVSLAGCFLAVGGKDFSLLNISQWGLISGLGSAFCWGFANIWLRRLRVTYSPWTALIYGFIFASLFWFLFNPPWSIIAAGYDLHMWEVFTGMALISVLIPHSLYYLGLQYLTASRAIITATFEPVVAILSAFLMLGESLVPIQLIGALLVIMAIALLQLKQERPAEALT